MLKNATPAQEFIKYALLVGAIQFIPRELSNGRISPYFFNSGKFDSGKKVAELTAAYARVICENLRGGFAFDLMYGIPERRESVVSPIAIMLDTLGIGDVSFCTSRKEPKEHGEGDVLIGAPIAPEHGVLIIGDDITDGEAEREAVEFIRERGGKPIGLVIAFDRQERDGMMGGLSATQRFEQKYGVRVRSIATFTDLIDVLEDRLGDGLHDRFGYATVLKKLLAYRKEYGVT